MPKYVECRNCRSFCWIAGCSSGGRTIRCAHVIGPGGELCPGFWPHGDVLAPKPEAPAVTPLLVDDLVNTLHMLWDRRYTDGDESGVTPGYTIRLTPAECNRVHRVLIRHQEEVGDA